ncbi:complex I subunit 5 family protein [Serpentinimonas barnesii]|uniref:complex I subunit 5 family protein n=1 Tax=Serpentinimonas barnesii TaxID=1458427 RepID=UPI00069323ED|nr:complex I subunit 5 family protein [Serpentinimonas barnesii]
MTHLPNMETLLPLLALWPLLLLALLLWRRSRAWAAALAPWAAVPALLLALYAVLGAALMSPAAASLNLQTAAAPPTLEWPHLLLGLRFGLDATGSVFLLLAGLLWTLAGWAAHIYHRHDARRHALWGFWLAALSGNLWLIVAQDAIGFYAGFALMSFAAYGLIVHARSAEAWRAGRIYLIMAVLGEALLLSGLLLRVAGTDSIALPLAANGGAHANLATVLIFLGFGVKAGVLGLHLWLPLAHPVAPTPASAVLSGVMIKAGLLGWMRFLPLGAEPWPLLGAAALGLGLLAALVAVAIGLTQRQPKVLLAYSSISQMGLLTLGIGAALLHPSAWPALALALTLYALHHGLAKGTLFLGVAVLAQATGTARRWALAAQALPALALAGVPLSSGFWAKDGLKQALSGLPAPWPEALAWLLPVAAFGTTLLMARLLWLQAQPAATAAQAAAPQLATCDAHAPPFPAASHPTPSQTVAASTAGTPEHPSPSLRAPWLALLLASCALALPGLLAWLGLIAPLPLLPTAAPALGSLALALLPLLLGAALSTAALHHPWRAVPQISPGDLLGLIDAPLQRFWFALLALSARLDRYRGPSPTPAHRWPRTLWLEERQLRRLPVAGMALLALLLLSALLSG